VRIIGNVRWEIKRRRAHWNVWAAEWPIRVRLNRGKRHERVEELLKMGAQIHIFEQERRHREQSMALAGIGKGEGVPPESEERRKRRELEELHRKNEALIAEILKRAKPGGEA
jgi:hypothetical protein